MMRRVNRMAATLTIVCALALPALARAQSGGAVPPQGPHGMGPRPGDRMEALNLTDEQRQQIQTLVADDRAAHQADFENLRTLENQLKNGIFADEGPSASLDAVITQIGTVQATMLQARVALEQAISKVLTVDQRRKMREMPGPGLMPPMGPPR